MERFSFSSGKFQREPVEVRADGTVRKSQSFEIHFRARLQYSHVGFFFVESAHYSEWSIVVEWGRAAIRVLSC